jgi:hypothetical protein
MTKLAVLSTHVLEYVLRLPHLLHSLYLLYLLCLIIALIIAMIARHYQALVGPSRPSLTELCAALDKHGVLYVITDG